MASESSELTFVRCPSCRSLVPVSASRCRICNNPLDGGGKGAEGEAAKQGGRVRQKTVSASAEELLRMDGEAAGKTPPPAAPPVAQSQTAFGDDGDHEEVDPLADFLQEFEAEASHSGGAPTPTEAAAAAANDDDDDDDLESFLDELDSYDAPMESPVPTAAKSAPITKPVVEPPLGSSPTHGELDEFDDESDPLESFMTSVHEQERAPAPQPVKAVAPPPVEPQYVPEPPPPPPMRPVPPRQQVEKRPPPPPPPQKPQTQQPQHQQAKHARPGNDQRGAREQKNAPPQGDRRDNAPRDRGESHRHEHRGEEQRKGNHQGAERPQERQHDRAPHRPEVQSAGPKTGKMRPGRLFGWLVSFESPDGRSIELREGKFFVTGSSIRGTDLVIEDASISTPHALMSVSADKGLLIQDLMSERGVFVRAGERGQYKREDGVVELKHGDWIRFGDVEFLVTVVPIGR